MKTKTLFLLILSLFITQTIIAQNTTQQVQEIRKMYADAKDRIAKNGKGNTPKRDMELVFNEQDYDNAPPRKEVVRYYYLQEVKKDANNEDKIVNKLYFMTCKMTFGDIDIYSEWLCDTKTGQLVFAFTSTKFNDGTKAEARYYWKDGELIDNKIYSDMFSATGIEQIELYKAFKTAFDSVANRNK